MLIAEHDPIDIELMHHELKKSGLQYTWKTVQNKNDYIEALHTFIPDIILSDYTFPSFDGPTAFELRERIAPDTPFIFLSGTIGEEKSIELIKNGVTDYCLKDKIFTLNPKVLRALKESAVKMQKKQMEQELMRSEKRLARAQHVAHMGNWEWDFATNYVNWSEEIVSIYGRHPHQAGHSLESALSFIHVEDLDCVSKKIELARETLQNFSVTYRIVRNNGSVRHIYLDSKLEFNIEGRATGFFGIAHDVTDMILLQNTLAQERITKQEEITHAVLSAQEDERAEIGKELHDNLNQILGATKLYIELAKTDETHREMYLDKSSAYIAKVIEQIRKISKSLIIPSADAMGLFDCIKILKDDLTQIHPIKIHFNVDNINETELEEKLQLNIYRIIQEQLNNILKHANATRAIISLSRQADEIILVISDNGIGYDTLEQRKGVGITNIMSRVEYFRGKTKIKSRSGKGFELKIEIPYGRPLINARALSPI